MGNTSAPTTRYASDRTSPLFAHIRPRPPLPTQRPTPPSRKDNRDVLFSMVNYARFLEISPENALERTNKKFIKRFQFLEKEAKKINKSLKEMTLAEMSIFWDQAKKLA